MKNKTYLLISLLVAVIFGGILLLQKNQFPGDSNGSAVLCAEEVRQCSDGSFVSRVAPNCEFENCPDIKTYSCKQASDCVVAYDGQSSCFPCTLDIGNDDLKCASREEAENIFKKRFEDGTQGMCEMCIEVKKNFECSCVEGMCKKTEIKTGLGLPRKMDFKYVQSFFGMAKSFHIFEDRTFEMIDETAPMKGDTTDECRYGEISMEEYNNIIILSLRNNLLDLNITQKDDLGLICEGGDYLTLKIGDRANEINPPCVDKQLPETKKVSETVSYVISEIYKILESQVTSEKCK